DAVIALLRAQLPEAQRGMVRHSVKQDTLPPFHLIGEIDADNIGGKGEQYEQLTVDVVTIYRGADRRELLALMHPIRVAANDATLIRDGVRFRITWRSSAIGTVASDGVTFAGITILEVTAEPA
ncbi:hypothetical protein LTR94_031382, partial [Friedmanniomyces endolithicus]